MIKVTKTEAEEIRKMKPEIKIIRTMIGKSKRGIRYCPEYREIIEWLKKTRGVDIIN